MRIMLEEKEAVENLNNQVSEKVNAIEEIFKKVDSKWSRQQQRQQYNQYVSFVVSNRKRGAKHRKNRK